MGVNNFARMKKFGKQEVNLDWSLTLYSMEMECKCSPNKSEDVCH